MEQTEPPPGTDPLPEMSVMELVKEAINESQALLKTEIALARDEAKREISAVKRVAIAGVVTLISAIMGLSLLLVGAVLAIGVQPLPAFLIGGGLLVVAIIAGAISYKSIPQKPMEQTQERLQEDVQVLKERIA